MSSSPLGPPRRRLELTLPRACKWRKAGAKACAMSRQTNRIRLVVQLVAAHVEPNGPPSRLEAAPKKGAWRGSRPRADHKRGREAALGAYWPKSPSVTQPTVVVHAPVDLRPRQASRAPSPASSAPPPSRHPGTPYNPKSHSRPTGRPNAVCPNPPQTPS